MTVNKLTSVKNLSLIITLIFCIVSVFTGHATFKEVAGFLTIILPTFWAINVAQKKVLNGKKK